MKEDLRIWSSNSDLELFTDSAEGKGRGFGIYFGGKWLAGQLLGKILIFCQTLLSLTFFQ
jgi:hypothetical protein